jgi:hypothetical protein
MQLRAEAELLRIAHTSCVMGSCATEEVNPSEDRLNRIVKETCSRAAWRERGTASRVRDFRKRREHPSVDSPRRADLHAQLVRNRGRQRLVAANESGFAPRQLR